MEVKITERVKESMQACGFNQKQLAEKIGMNPSSVSDWLSGKRLPNILSLWLLADCLEESVDYLIGRIAD